MGTNHSQQPIWERSTKELLSIIERGEPSAQRVARAELDRRTLECLERTAEAAEKAAFRALLAAWAVALATIGLIIAEWLG
jgi:hypothetical protein